MIRALRRRHRRVVAGLAVIGPVIFSLGLWLRPGTPLMESVPAPLDNPPVTGPTDTLRIGDTWFVVTAGVPAETGEPDLRVVPVRDSLTGRAGDAAAAYGPDVLLYWSDRAPEGALPAEAWLLGPLRGVRPAQFHLPSAVWGTTGYLVAFSLAGQRVIGSAAFTPPADRD